MERFGPGRHGAHDRESLYRRFGERAVRRAVADGVLRLLWRPILVDAGRFLDPSTRCSAALMLAGRGAAVTGVSAAWLHGCRAVEPDATHVVLHHGRSLRRRQGLVFHSSMVFADDVSEIDGLRVLRLDRVVADLLCSLRAKDGLALADEALRNAGSEHEVVRTTIAGQLRRRQDPRGSVRAAGLLDLATPRSASPAESWLRLHLVRRGFPLPEVNWPLLGLDGRELYFLDLAWPSLRIVVEYDGYAAHVGRAEADAERAADLARRGWLVVRADVADLRDMGRLDRRLRRAFAARGYAW